MCHSPFVLSTLLPKPKELGGGSLSIDKRGEAMFFENEGGSGAAILATLRRVQIDSASAHGIHLSGMQPDGVGRDGVEKFKYQEWWLRYANAPTPK